MSEDLRFDYAVTVAEAMRRYVDEDPLHGDPQKWLEAARKALLKIKKIEDYYRRAAKKARMPTMKPPGGGRGKHPPYPKLKTVMEQWQQDHADFFAEGERFRAAMDGKGKELQELRKAAIRMEQLAKKMHAYAKLGKVLDGIDLRLRRMLRGLGVAEEEQEEEGEA